MQLTSLTLHGTTFNALPPSWTALTSLRKLALHRPGPLHAASALQPLGSWTQLTWLHIDAYRMAYACGSLEQQLTRLSALQHLHMEWVPDFELPPGRWQAQLTSLECDLEYVLPEDGSPSRAVLAHATSLRVLVACNNRGRKPTQLQLRALLGALAGLPALEYALLGRWLKDIIEEAHTALGSPLGARLEFEE